MPDAAPKSFAEWLAARMTRANMKTQSELRAALASKRVVVTPQAVNRWCLGTGLPDRSHLVALLDLFVVVGADRDAAYRLYALPLKAPTAEAEGGAGRAAS